jgi:ABC-type sugar transport system permease subunit
MATAAAARSPSPSEGSLWLNVLTVWHGLVTLASLGALFWVWQNNAETNPFWWQVALSVALLLIAAGSGLAAFFIIRRSHRGRVASLMINYLGLVACFFSALNVLDVYTGISALANTFGRGLPFLIVAFLGVFISSLGDRYEHNPAQERLFRQAGKIIALIGLVIFLFRIDTLSGLLAIASGFDSLLSIGLAAGAVLFGLMVWAMWRRPAAEALQANNAHSELLNGWLFLSPNLLGFLVFFAGPLLFSLYISFTDSDAFQTPNWIGFNNYTRVFNLSAAQLETSAQRFNEVMDAKVYSELTRVDLFGNSFVVGAEDKLFWLALRNTLLLMLVIVPLSIIPALFLANLLNSKLPGMKFFRAVYFIPSIAAVVGIALIWQLLFNAAIGYINYGITSTVAFINSFGPTIADPQIRWLSDSRTALLSVAIIVVWQVMGFNTVIFLAGLQQIPRDLYEAATVDGAGRWAQFWKITLPMLAPTTFFVITTTTIQAMQVFDHIFILINPPAGPNNSTLSMVLYLYQQGFQRFSQGYASAIAWVLFILIFGVTLLQFQRNRASAYEG